MTYVKLVEVGPRDGLQNEKQPVSLEARLELIRRLEAAGVRHIEAAAFVSPKWVPQMTGSDELMRRLPRTPGVHYSALVPNMKGLEAALAAGCEEVAVFGAASESFSQRNINCSIRESIARFEPVAQAAHAAGVAVRGYVSCVLGCPYEGDIAPEKVAEVAQMLADLGCHEISLGDTIGRGTPDATRRMIAACAARVPVARLAGHFHDTYGMAVANVAAALAEDVRIFDSAVAGLGGCPYAPGASGNVASEEVVYLLQGMGFDTGIDLAALASAGAYICAQLGRTTGSRVARALQGTHCESAAALS